MNIFKKAIKHANFLILCLKKLLLILDVFIIKNGANDKANCGYCNICEKTPAHYKVSSYSRSYQNNKIIYVVEKENATFFKGFTIILYYVKDVA